MLGRIGRAPAFLPIIAEEVDDVSVLLEELVRHLEKRDHEPAFRRPGRVPAARRPGNVFTWSNRKPDLRTVLVFQAAVNDPNPEIARLARENSFAVAGSSANRSLTGSKFVFEDIEDQVRDIADITIDYGLVPYNNDKGLGSSIVDLVSYETIRVGAVYDEICDILLDRFDIDLKAIMAVKG